MRLFWSTASGLALMAVMGFTSSHGMAAPPSTPPNAEQSGDKSNRDEKNVREKDAQRDANKGGSQQEDKDKPRDADREKKDGDRDSRDADRNRNAGDAGKNRDTPKSERDGKRTEGRDQRDGDRDRTTRDAERDRNTHDKDRNSSHGRRSSKDLGFSFDRITDRGLPIGKLSSDSVVSKAGFRQGDVILSVNGRRLGSADDFERYVYAGPRRDRVKIIVWRDNQEEVIFLEPTVLYVEDEAVEDRPYFGIDYDHQYNDRIVIIRVHPDSPAYAAGLRKGDVISTWNGERITSADDFVKTIRETQPGTVKFEYTRDSKKVGAEARFGRREARRDSRR